MVLDQAMTRARTVPLPRSLRRRAGAEPLHVQLYARVRRAVLEGTLAPGARLPSARALAQAERVSRGTVDLAYARLAVEGFVEARGAAGTFVSSGLPAATRAPAPAPPPRADVGARRGPAIRPLQVGVPAVDAFPVAAWSRLLGRHARRARAGDLAHADPLCDRGLSEAIAAHLAIARGVLARAEDVVITAGYQGALGLVLAALARPGDAAWLEDPGYGRARAAVALAGLRAVPVPVDAEGLDVAAGVARGPEARLALVTPGHQMPLGMTLSLPRRLALLAWAREANAFVLEDDYDGEFHYDAPPLPALKSLDDRGTVVYAGTFSKSMFPSLRLGFVVAQGRAREAIARTAALLMPAPSLVVQRAVADFLAEGHYARHVRRMRALYAQRRAALLDAIEALASPQLDAGRAPGGLHLVARLRGAGEAATVARAVEAGLAPEALSSYHAGGAGTRREGLLLGFAALPAARAPEAVARLGAALRAAARDAVAPRRRA